MPRYEYRCDECNTIIEVTRRMDQRDAPHPVCGGDLIIDDIGGDARIENGSPHTPTFMYPIISRLAAVFVKGRKYA